MLICFATFSNAQNDFDSQWQAVAKFEKEGLTKSAADLLDSIYKSALNKNDKQQCIKALLYKSKYLLTLEEEAQLKIVNLFKSEINKSDDLVTKRLLENILATMYWQYFQQNRYKFYNRTKTSEKISDDFRTWDLETLFNEIHVNYKRSLENGLILQQEPLGNYKTLLAEAKNSKDYRPSLFDLLSHNAIAFYKTDENSITQPAYKFTIDNAALISDSEAFINLNLKSKDSTSLQLNALKIYQNLLKFHRKDELSKAFVANDIERLKFISQHATFETKEDLLLETLKEKTIVLESSPLSTLYNFEIASLYQQQGNRYNSNPDEGEVDENNRWKLKEALALCNSVISEYQNSDGAKKCEILKQQISRPYLRLEAEEFTPKKLASRLLVNYKNLNTLNFNIYKVNKRQLEAYNKGYNAAEKKKFFNNFSATATFTSHLKTEGDYQIHSTEIVVPSLPNGLYLIKAKTNSEEDVFAVAHVQITNLALVESNESKSINYQLINRTNGEPSVGAKIILTYTNNRNKKITRKFTTDRFGKFKFEQDDNYYRNVEVEATYKDETAYFGDYYISRTYDQRLNNDTQYKNFLFTDRSIYRPGQVVFFKGISTQTKADKTTVFANNDVQIRLKNVNGEVVNELLLETNEFGSVSGEFILPNDGLTGNYTIDMFSGNTGYTSFSVEEYKRPKFKPEFQPITETYKVNDSITVNGTTIAFAGSAITDAKVVYRVKRMVQYPNWYYWRRPYFNSEPQEITFGESKTNAKGEFDITFKALPDESVSKNNLPVFRYEVSADITDINGETRTANTTVNVGYHAMIINIIAPDLIDKTKNKVEISLVSQNLNSEFVPATGTLKIYKLEAPETVLRPRPWSAPDYQVISRAEFKTLFPHDPFNDEGTLANWKKGKEVFKTNFDTKKQKTIILKRLQKWTSGKYIIVVESKDKFEQALKDEAYTSLFSHSDKTLADNLLFEGQLDKATYKAGDVAKLTIASAAKDVTVTVEVEKDNKILVTHLIKLNNSKQTISVPVLESDLGGFDVHISFAAFNAFTSQNFRVNVPYPKTDLEIETTTFRDKLQPGQDETWSFKIKGPKGERVSAELLASMYDASLDEFKGHNWSFNPINNPSYYSRINKNDGQSFGTTHFRLFNSFNTTRSYPQQNYDQLNWFGFYFGNDNRTMVRSKRAISYSSDIIMAIQEDAEVEDGISMFSGEPGSNKNDVIISGNASLSSYSDPLYIIDGVLLDQSTFRSLNQESIIAIKILKGAEALTAYGEKGKHGVIIITTNAGQNEFQKVKVRKNLNETAFFFPKLQTDAEGNVSFNFKAPEALTKWKLQLLAHTKTLESAVTQLEAVTQKELMVIPNTPRFLREGDRIVISTKIANLTDKKLVGQAQLILTNPITGEDLSYDLIVQPIAVQTMGLKYSADEAFSVDAKGNTQVSWSLNIPDGLRAVQYKVLAKSEDFSDGEQNALPVLSNRMLVTETLPMWVRSNQTKIFTLDKLKNQSSTTLKHHQLTLEMTSNPAWYAVQALPYLMEYPYDCNEQTFSRYYANALAQHIVKSNPKIEAVFNQWAPQETLMSNLEKNEALKSLLIQETPWLRDAQSETEQKKRIGLLFDLNKMNNELQTTLHKLKNNQSSTGAWPWFNGGRDNRYITQHIIAGFGHLKQLNVSSSSRLDQNSIIQNALSYLDSQFVKEYKDLKKHNKDVDLTKDHLSHTQLHYLYMRSFYPEINTSKEVEAIMDYYQSQIQKYWLKRSLYAKGLMALSMHRMDDSKTATKILKSLKENSITSDELGMYWKANTNSWHWYQAPIETQALLIEAFSEIENDVVTIDNLKIWLLKNKQTNQWKTTKATTEAVYALLLQGSDWLDITEMVDVKVGKETISPETSENVRLEAGTGYYKTTWTGSEITKEQADVTITKKGDGIAWGALYWQYFEDLDKITSAETPLKLSKKLFLKSNTDKGEEISEINSDTKLKVGDLVRVRIELRTDRSMEFVHLKDMRAAGFEPINVISQYKWQDGLGYYESTKDAATNFFMDYLPKGVYVFEYDLRVNNAGDMSNGISTIQSMYAPEFSSHSEGARILVD
jgi:uncharacterized protein YfaS (alpha-2-macroglobulin family)